MFITFFYMMRARGLNTTLDQWMTLMEALGRNMADSSLTTFYHLCRCILINSEADFDKFDEVFLEYFKTVETHKKITEGLPDALPEDFRDWLTPDPEMYDLYYSEEHMEILRRLMECIERILKRIQEEIEQSGGEKLIGACEVCVGCGACARGFMKRDFGMGDGDSQSQSSQPQSAISMANERRFRDFREDTVLNIRQFQVAFRKLRQYSARVDLPETELDIDQTVTKTSQNAGLLKIVYGKPRKNTLKLLALFDSDGSMAQYSAVSNQLFQAVSKANHFKDLKFYYFHNCIYDHLYTSPVCINGEWEETERIMYNLDGDYRVIYIGDASMANSELFEIGGNSLLERSNRLPGLEWLKRMKRRYAKSVWLNPISKNEWNRLYGGQTMQAVSNIFPMYELTVNGLEEAVKKLLVAR
jgi:uncharacterized protein with von Willebrand factor type A (vWA) domain